ncbi:MAG: 50S ribosomal protein L21 [Candidatus Omnitrophota bacterium]|nr:50S ribosomal protein L21 [Candidatus Omnitrophota bacterium]
MYAVIETGKKQYKVVAGDIIEVEKLDDVKDKVIFDRVLLVSDKDTVIGHPYIEGAKVIATVLKQVRSVKTIAYRYRRRKGYHRRRGHRQDLTRVKIKEIKA